MIDDSTEAIWDGRSVGDVGAQQPRHDPPPHPVRPGPDGEAGAPPAPSPADLELGLRRARAAALLELALPGGAYIYQGDELGLPEVEDLPDDVLDDPIWERSGRHGRAAATDAASRCRGPAPQPPFGFGPGRGQPWLPQPPSWRSSRSRRSGDDPASHLSLYRAALRIRRQHPALGDGRLRWVDTADDVLCFDRDPGFRCVVNFGARSVRSADAPTRCCSTSQPLEDGASCRATRAAWLSV